MALVIQVANMIEKHKEEEGVKEYLEQHLEAWDKFVITEVRQRNDLNSR